MFVRKKQNKSGTTSIQIIDKSRGYKVLETVGSSKDREEINRLFLEAKNKIVTNYKKQLNLFAEDNLNDVVIDKFISTLDSSNIRVVGPEMVFGKIFDKIGFGKIPEELFKDLVISRLICPRSKLKTIEYLQSNKGKTLSVQSLYRFLDRFNSKYKEEVEQISFTYTKTILGGEITVAFYDVTTLYFEIEDEDDLRTIGFSKDGKFQCPQILIGLLIGVSGYPIGYDIFEGNKFEGHTLIPVLEKFEKKYGIKKPIIVADAGLLSKDNIATLTTGGYKYIIGARLKNESEEIKNKILEKFPTKIDGSNFFIEKDKLRLVVSYSNKRAFKDEKNREKGISKLKKQITSGKLTKENINNRGYNKFLKLENTIKVSLDEIKIQEDAKWDGLKGYITNTALSSDDVIKNYKQLWQIEKAFRISKTDLKIRPIYHYKRNRIEAHICISFVAYTIYKELERILNENKISYSPAKVAELTKTIYEINYIAPDTKILTKRMINLTNEQKIIYRIMLNYI